MHFVLLAPFVVGGDLIAADQQPQRFGGVRHLHAEGFLQTEYPLAKLEKNYIKACAKGLLKVMSKMGISTQQSYRGAQIFEAIGLNRPFVEEYFTGTASRIQGVGLETIAEEAVRWHEHAPSFP